MPQCGAATCLGQKQLWELRDIGDVSLETSLTSGLGPASHGLCFCLGWRTLILHCLHP